MSDQVSPEFRHILCADARFTTPDALNDQCWELGFGTCEPSALSLSTTFGLRVNRMHLFPQFHFEKTTVSDPGSFHKYPSIELVSTNFASIFFSPFPDIDVNLKIWVPSSQLIMGTIYCSNTSATITDIGIDWLVQLSPMAGGNPMKFTELGINTVLAGESSGVAPVFFITGGPQPSSTAYPGLGAWLLLLPGTVRQHTWVLASTSSLEASFLQARQYSAYNLENEQIKVEMADKRDRVHIDTADTDLNRRIRASQNRALQFIMPPVASVKHKTCMNKRDTETGSYPKPEILGVYPEWSGQTLTDLLLIFQSLLPASPRLTRELIDNLLDAQHPDGSIDYRVNVNHVSTGFNSLPLLASLVWELYAYLQDSNWLSGVFPRLTAFVDSWVRLGENGEVSIRELDHPAQLDFQTAGAESEELLADFWVKLKSSRNHFLSALLVQELGSLLNIARSVQDDAAAEKYTFIRAKLIDTLGELRDEKFPAFQYMDKVSGEHLVGKVLCQFKHNHVYKPRSRITSPGCLYLKLNAGTHIPPSFACEITGAAAGGPACLVITPEHMVRVGCWGVAITDQAFTEIESITIRNLPDSGYGIIGQADLADVDSTQLLAQGIGEPPSRASDEVGDFLTPSGIRLYPQSSGGADLRLPRWIAVLIIEGLLKNRDFEQAEKVFDSVFAAKSILYNGSLPQTSRVKTPVDLFPVKLFLKMNGVTKLTESEITFSHRGMNSQPLTVQYRKIRINLKPEVAEILTTSGESFTLKNPVDQKIIL